MLSTALGSLSKDRPVLQGIETPLPAHGSLDSPRRKTAPFFRGLRPHVMVLRPQHLSRKTAPFFRGLRRVIWVIYGLSLQSKDRPVLQGIETVGVPWGVKADARSKDRPVLQGIETPNTAQPSRRSRRKTAPFFRGLRHKPAPGIGVGVGRKTAPFFRGLRLNWAIHI